MHYLILFLFFFTFPAHAEFGFGGGISKPNHMVVAGSSVIDDDDTVVKDYYEYEEGEEGYDKKPNDDGLSIADDYETTMPIEPTQPIAPIPPKINTKKVLKKIPLAKTQRSINDDRIDDSYVQKLIRDNLNFTRKID